MNKDALSKIAAKHGLRLLVEFGSVVTGKSHLGSDYDVAADWPQQVSRDDKESLRRDLQRAVEGDLDLVFLDEVGPLLLAAIARDGKPLYQQGSSDFNEFVLRAWREYYDYKPYLMKRAELNSHRFEIAENDDTSG